VGIREVYNSRTMAPEDKLGIAALMEHLALYMAERRALLHILKQSVADWQEQLSSLRQTPEYQAILAEWAPAIQTYREDADFEALLPLLEQVRKQGPPN
jgi:hypothetical protein